jgi:hypothetical protein
MKPETYGFGVDPMQSQNHFYVWISSRESASPPCQSGYTRTALADGGQFTVQVYERFSWTPEREQILGSADKLRIAVSGHKWGRIKDALSAEFNFRLKKEGLKIGKFPGKGGAVVERLFGKEMMVLLWAIEDCDPSIISTAVRNWKGLLPEERWWLYTMTNAATGEVHDRKGWRTALRYALCENPVVERPQMSLFDLEAFKL